VREIVCAGQHAIQVEPHAGRSRDGGDMVPFIGMQNVVQRDLFCPRIEEDLKCQIGVLRTMHPQRATSEFEDVGILISETVPSEPAFHRGFVQALENTWRKLNVTASTVEL